MHLIELSGDVDRSIGAVAQAPDNNKNNAAEYAILLIEIPD